MRIFIFLSALIILFGCNNNQNNVHVDSEPKESRTIYLIRHAKSSHGDTSLTDFERPLVKKGKAAAVLIGEKLMNRGIVLDKMVISPAKRSKSTAKRIAKGLTFEKDSIQHDTIIYKCKTQELISIIRNLAPQYKSVAIIGHNPSTIQAANHFQKDTIFTAVPTCGVIAIRFESASWAKLGHKEGKFLFFDCPKNYKDEK
jgi:phosphohistidine phosphatase